MTSRREFLGYAGAATLLASLRAPAAGLPQLPPRLIPGRPEALPIIGLGNSTVFREPDLSAAAGLLEIFLQHGGGYVDAGGVSRLSVGTIARNMGASARLFIGNYLEPRSVAAMRQEAARVAAGQGKDALDLVHTRDLDAYRAGHDRYRQLQADGLVRYIGIARSGADGYPAIGRLIDDGLVDFIQVNYSLLEPEAAERLLPLAADKGVAVCINRPFINGRYFGIIGQRELPSWAADFDCASWAQFSLKFIIAHPAVNCVLTETSDPEHARDNLAAGYGRLPDAATREKMLAFVQGL